MPDHAAKPKGDDPDRYACQIQGDHDHRKEAEGVGGQLEEVPHRASGRCKAIHNSPYIAHSTVSGVSVEEERDDA